MMDHEDGPWVGDQEKLTLSTHAEHSKTQLASNGAFICLLVD